MIALCLLRLLLAVCGGYRMQASTTVQSRPIQQSLAREFDSLPASERRPSQRAQKLDVLIGLRVADSGVSEIRIEKQGGLGFGWDWMIAEIHIDGALHYVGTGRYQMPGTNCTGRVNQKDLDQLCRFVVESGYMTMDSNYDNGMTDAAVTFTKVTYRGKSKVIRNYFGSGPPTLWAIEQLVQKLIAEAKWDPIDPNKQARPFSDAGIGR
jgi:hypothetical protein